MEESGFSYTVLLEDGIWDIIYYSRDYIPYPDIPYIRHHCRMGAYPYLLLNDEAVCDCGMNCPEDLLTFRSLMKL